MEDSRKGVYEAAIIQKVVNAMWFKNRRDEGVKFPEIFNPLPVRAIAFILTAVCSLDLHQNLPELCPLD